MCPPGNSWISSGFAQVGYRAAAKVLIRTIPVPAHIVAECVVASICLPANLASDEVHGRCRCWGDDRFKDRVVRLALVAVRKGVRASHVGVVDGADLPFFPVYLTKIGTDLEATVLVPNKGWIQ